MRRFLVMFLILSVPATFLLVGMLKGAEPQDKIWKPTPLMRTVTPAIAQPGDKVTAAGEFLGKANVAEVYLIAGDETLKAAIVSQTDSAIRFTVPATAKGRMRLMVLTADSDPRYIEQPVVLEMP